MRSEVKDILVEQLWGDAGVIRHEYTHPAITASGFYRSRHVLSLLRDCTMREAAG